MVERPVLLVGPVGTGKTSVAQGVLQKLDPAAFNLLTINLSAQVCLCDCVCVCACVCVYVGTGSMYTFMTGKASLELLTSTTQVISVCKYCIMICKDSSSTLGVPTKNPRMNKLDSSMLKSKNEVTLFVNYSYNSFYDFHPSENK